MKIAVVQMDVSLGQVEGNLQAMLARLKESRKQGARLTIFPECALTGYCFPSIADALPHAQSIPGPATDRFQTALKELGGTVVFGLIERHDAGIYNAAAIVTADGVVSSYRKNHLPFLGIDQFATYGDRPFQVVEVEGVRLGLSICYDSAFPESMRTMMLRGADLFVLPTNFPSGAECMTDHVLRTRALENKVYFAAANRIGEEMGFRFIGRSQIVDPSGNKIAATETDDDVILYAEIDVEQARNKRVGRSSIFQALDRVADRRPELYGALIEPHSLPRPGREA